MIFIISHPTPSWVDLFRFKEVLKPLTSQQPLTLTPGLLSTHEVISQWGKRFILATCANQQGKICIFRKFVIGYVKIGVIFLFLEIHPMTLLRYSKSDCLFITQ